MESPKKEAGLPNVVFHSLRHSSATYKLKLSHGDLKATQGDTGHAQIDMITEVYSHILDEDRKINAQKFEVAFYSNPDLRKVTPPKDNNNLDLQTLIVQLQSNPELAVALSQVSNNQKSKNVKFAKRPILLANRKKAFDSNSQKRIIIQALWTKRQPQSSHN